MGSKGIEQDCPHTKGNSSGKAEIQRHSRSWLRIRIFPLTIRKLMILIALASVASGAWFLLREVWWKYQKYPYAYAGKVTFDEIQFGNINGDKYPDLLTYGFLGMVVGNPYWFAGREGGFVDWNGVKTFDNVQYDHGQSGAKLCDLDGDGDADLISREGLFLNDGNGVVAPCRVQGQKSRYNDMKAFEEFCWLICNLYELETLFDAFDFHLVDVTGNGHPDILLLGEQKAVFGLARDKLDWEFFVLPGHHAVVLDSTDSKTPQLVFLNAPKKELADFLSNEKVRHRITHAALPQLPENLLKEKRGLEYHWLDMDGDGQGELALCMGKVIGDPSRAPHRLVVQWEIRILQEAHDRFEQLGAFTTGQDKCIQDRSSFRPPFAVHQFEDFDRDGDLDLIAPDHCIYRQDKGFSFAKALEIDLPFKGRFPARFFVHDVNTDGWPDVISSLHPFWNIKFGPLLK